MNKFLATLCISIASSSAVASMAIYQPIGSSTVLGGYGNRHALSTSLSNPAAAYLMANLQGFRVNFLGPLSIGLEAGAGPDLGDRVDALEATVDGDFPSGLDTIEADAEAVALDAIYNSTETYADAYVAGGGSVSLQDYNGVNYRLPDDSSAALNAAIAQAEADATAATDEFVVDKVAEVKAEIEDLIDQTNSLLDEVGETTFVKFSTSIQAPFLPLIYKTRRRGVFMIDASASIVGRASILADNLTVTGLDDLDSITSVEDLAAFDIDGLDYSSDMSVYMKRASDYHFSIGYSEMVSRTENSAVIYGGRLNFHKLSLDRKLTVLTEDGDSSVSYGDYFLSRDVVEENIGLDLGVILASKYYQMGATISNINEPEFDYIPLGDCAGLSGTDLNTCNAAIRLADKGYLSLKESYKMKAQMTLDFALKSKDQAFSLATSFDANSIKDPLGDKYQWATASISFFSPTALFPGIRAGYRKNMVGSELSYITAGVTIGRRLDIDIAYAAENDQGASGTYFSIGYGFMF